VETFKLMTPMTTYTLTRENPVPKQIDLLKKLLGPKYTDVETCMNQVLTLKTTTPLTEDEKTEVLKITGADKIEATTV